MSRCFARRVVALTVVAILGVFVAACGDETVSTSTASPAPEIEVLAPESFDVADYSGKALVVNFFGSWCGPCNAEAPDLAAFSAANPDVAFVGIAVSDKEASAVEFMQKYGLSYPIVIDDNSLSAAWGIQGVPTTIFFDASGQEGDRIVGAAGTDAFEASLAKVQ